MANWANISQNAQKYGDFAGRTISEQEAYFEFFGGADRSGFKSIFATVGKAFAKEQSILKARGLRCPFAGVASSKSTTRL